LEKEHIMRKIFRFYFLVAIAALLVGCSFNRSNTARNSSEAPKNTETSTYHNTDVTGPAASFDWNAKVGPVSYEKIANWSYNVYKYLKYLYKYLFLKCPLL